MTSEVKIAVGDIVRIKDNCNSSKAGKTGRVYAPHPRYMGHWHVEFDNQDDRLVFLGCEFEVVRSPGSLEVNGAPLGRTVRVEPEPLTYAEGYQDGAELVDKLTLRITELGVELVELRKSLARNDQEMSSLITRLHNKLGAKKATKLIRKAFRAAS
jgi:hypothetical protein